ncbi:MAG: gamma-glutamyltransferase [Alphaproteobacteria bacterium]
MRRVLGAALAVLALVPVAQAAEPVRAQRMMVVAADPRAVEAGLAVLREGGSAVDAAIAAQMVLNVVEPQSSGIGGGGFLVHYDATTHAVTTYDGRETAPAGAGADLFLGPDGQPLEFLDAVVGGRSVGVPGLLAMLDLAHQEHGWLEWSRLFDPAIALAYDGFEVSPRLALSIAETERMDAHGPTAALFLTAEGAPVAAGTVLHNPELGDTFALLAREGARGFYRKPRIPLDIIKAVRRFAANPGALSIADIAEYRAIKRPAVCGPYRVWVVCGMGPPSSGGIAVLQILTLLERFDLAAMSPDAVDAAHLIAEASRLAFADRNAYVADPDFVPVPTAGLIDPGYLVQRSALIDPGRSLGPAAPGTPPDRQGRAWPMDDGVGRAATTHISVVDGNGDAVALTSTIEGPFGSRLSAAGFVLNNELTDFAFAPEDGGEPVANRVEPGKRPRSSMAPTIVLDRQGRLVMVVGSPGGSRIIGYVVQAIVAVLDWGLDPQAAVDLPHVVNRNGATELEAATPAESLRDPLIALGHEVSFQPMASGLNVIVVTPDGLQGGADSRREGVAKGD